jgi:uncharacterized cupin superfamily protein
MTSFKDFFIKTTDIAVAYFDHEAKIGGLGSNFSKHFGLQRVGVHHFVIPAGFRTSRPHAESLEDEFVFVIKGEIDLWFNGRIKKMIAGDSIGFLPGTGIGHTFINNSSSDVELFVAGDRTKKENQYRFHLDPEFKVKCGDKWWESMPVQDLGGHNGLPGNYDLTLIDNNIKIENGFVDIPAASFSYTGDTETFSDGKCLSRNFGLKSIAIWIEKIPPTKRTSWPHAHSVEEEFIFVLRGEISTWLNGVITKAGPMTAIDFKAGSGVAHTLINETDEDVYYLCVGECKPKDDKIFYPLHPKRNEEVKVAGYLWEDCPKQVLSN